MTNKARSFSILLAIFGTLIASAPSAQAADLTWAGQYRFEGIKLSNPELSSAQRNKAYMLHHLSLSPKIVAADGVTIYSRLELFNFGAPYENSQLGQLFGSGPGDGTRDADRNNVLSQNEKSELLTVSQLYIQWAQEHGSLVVGRAPLQFGLGITHNAGLGQFDHWFDTRDLVGYKMVFGNMYAMPIIAKTSEGTLGHENDVNDYILHVQYENPETDLALGVFAEWRFATKTGTDTPDNGSIGGATPQIDQESYRHRNINLFAKQRFGNFKAGLEAGLNSGDAGLKTAAGQSVSINAYGIAAEIGYQKSDSRWDFGLRAGVASGDDPGTDDVYEGFVFDRNYDVAFMMFNHPLGRTDVLRTGAYRDTATTASDLPDVESISNAFYVSPRFNQRIGDRMSWGGNITWASASQKATAGSTSSTDLGFEVDLNFTYKPYERLTWITEAGFLFPGDAWKQETAGPEGDNKFAYGLTTKAAISF